MGAYFLRNVGFVLSGEPSPRDLIAAFRAKFDYPPDAEREFSALFSADGPIDIDFDWFEAAPLTTNEAVLPDEETNGV